MKEKLPIIMVAQRPEDSKTNISSGRVVFLEPFTEKLRNNIFSQCEEIKKNIGKIEEKEIPCIGKVVMKEKAIAKTHKPNNLFNDNTCPMVGGGKLNEIYVKITPEGINNLEKEIKNTKAQSKKAEMTKIEKIEMYTSDDVLKINLKKIEGPLKIKLFDYKNDKQNEKNKEIFLKKDKTEIFERAYLIDTYDNIRIRLINLNFFTIAKLLKYQKDGFIDYMYNADVNDSVFDYYDNIESEIIKEVSKLKQQNEIKVA